MTPLTLLLKGGLGNQLFQYGAALMAAQALGRSLDVALGAYVLNSGRKCYLREIVPELQVAGRLRAVLAVPLASDRIATSHWLRNAVLTDRSASEIGVSTGRWRWISGYFQHHRFTADVARRLSSYLRAGQVPCAKPYIAVHVRRTDFLSDRARAAEYQALMRGYYGPAIESARAELGQSCPVRVVSDDVVGAAGDLREIAGVSSNTGMGLTQEAGMWGDLACMAQASALVCSNSTFAWWAGRINSGMVVLPRRWLESERNRPMRGFDLQLERALLL